MTDLAARIAEIEDHAEIWLEPKCAENDVNGRLWCQDDVFDPCGECGHDPVRYVRADLYDAAMNRIGLLTECLDKLGYPAPSEGDR